MGDCCESLRAELAALRAEIARLKPVDENRIIQAAISGASELLSPRISNATNIATQASNLANDGLAKARDALERAYNAKSAADAAGRVAGDAASKAGSALSKAAQALAAIAALAASIAAFAAAIATLNILAGRIDAVENGLAQLGGDVSRILGLLNPIKSQAQRAEGKADTANDRANQASATANSAAGQAGRATEIAQAAQGIAQSAISKADTAIRDAGNAKSTADAANQTANQVRAFVQPLPGRIEQAQGTATSAKTTANEALAKVDNLLRNPVKGAKGDKGDRGERGERGLQGVPGRDGVTTVVTLPGQPGAKGDKGDRGERGLQGIPGLRGIKGDKGDKGEPGKFDMAELAGIQAQLNNISGQLGTIGFGVRANGQAIKQVPIEIIADNRRLATDVVPSKMQEAFCEELQNGRCFPAAMDSWLNNQPLARVPRQVENLQPLTQQLQRLTPVIVNTGSIVNTTNNNITRMGNQINNINNVTNNTNNQVTNNANQITNLGNQITNVNNIANNTYNQVTNNANQITNLGNQVNNITNVTNQTNTQLATVNNNVTNLTNQVNNITNVANQTNNQIVNVTNQVTNINNQTGRISASIGIEPITGTLTAHNCVVGADMSLPYAGLGVYGLQSQITQLSQQLEMTGKVCCRTYQILGGNSWFTSAETNIPELDINPEKQIKDSIKRFYNDNTKSSAVDTQPLTGKVSNLPNLLIGIESSSWRRQGLHKLPITAPPSIMPNIARNPRTGEILSVRDWRKDEQQKITDNVSFQAYQLAQFQSVMGAFPTSFDIEVEEGGKVVNRKIWVDNVSDALSEIMGLGIALQDDMEINTQVCMKATTEITATKNAAVITQDLALANAKYLGYQITKAPKTIKTLITPGSTNIRDFLKPSEQQIISYNHRSGHLEQKLNTLLVSAGITKAALTGYYDPNQANNVPGNIIARDALRTIEKNEDDWIQFLKMLRQPDKDLKIDDVPTLSVEDITNQVKDELRKLQ